MQFIVIIIIINNKNERIDESVAYRGRNNSG